MEEELKLAFDPNSKNNSDPKDSAKKATDGFTLENSKKKTKQKTVTITFFALGMITLVAGIVFLILKIVAEPKILDAEYLVSIGKWGIISDSNCNKTEETPEAGAKTEESEITESTENSDNTAVAHEVQTNCSPSVIWNFTEPGKGTLTTNNHINDYDFIWTIEGNILKIETNWLYTLNDEFTYTLDRENGTLTLKQNEIETVFSQISSNANE